MLRFFISILIVATLGNKAFAAGEDWSLLENANTIWLNSGVTPSEDNIDTYIQLSNFNKINYYTLNQFLTNSVNGWKIGKMLNYPNWRTAGPVIYSNIQVSQRPLMSKRTPTGVFYFIEKDGDPHKRLTVTPESDTGLYVTAPAIGVANGNNPLIAQFEKELKDYSAKNNAFLGAVVQYKGGVFSFLEHAEKLNATWDNLILDEGLKTELKKGIDGFLMNYDYAQWKKLGLPMSQGVLLSGPPGTGKSLVAKILSTNVLEKKYKSPFTYIHVQAANINSLTNVKEIYDTARTFGNTIIYFEDIDLIAGTDRFNRPAIKNELMQQLSGMEKLEGVITIGTTNYGKDIDPALRRSQRLGLHYEFGPLLVPQRKQLLAVMFKDKAGTDLDLDNLAVQTDQFTGADLQQLSNICMDEAFKRAQRQGQDIRNVKVSNADAVSGFQQFRYMKFKRN
jgi:AAA+ superfamily predicted ATPase